MAEKIISKRLAERKIKNVKVSSAGLYADVGEPMSKNAVSVLKSLGIKNVRHTAKRFDVSDVNKYNVIITMTGEQKNAIGPYKNVFSFAEYIDGYDVPDPYGQDERAYKKVAEYFLYAEDEIIDKALKVKD